MQCVEGERKDGMLDVTTAFNQEVKWYFFKTVGKMRETHAAGTTRPVTGKLKDEEEGIGKER